MKNRLAHLRLVNGNEGENGHGLELVETLPRRTNLFEPCELYVLKDHLILMLEMALEAIDNNRARVDGTPEDRAQTIELIAQRKELLAWARRQSDDLVYMALYPASEENEGDDVKSN